MTISNEVYRHDYAGNDSTVLFAIGFYFLLDAHIKAILYNLVTDVETELTLTTHYTLTGAGNVNGGELTMLTAPTSNEILTILRDVDLKQEENYIEGESFPAEDHETALDKLTMIVQQVQEQVDRIIRKTVTTGTAAPSSETWKRGDLCWNSEPSADGTPGWVCITSGSPGTWKAMADLEA